MKTPQGYKMTREEILEATNRIFYEPIFDNYQKAKHIIFSGFPNSEEYEKKKRDVESKLKESQKNNVPKVLRPCFETPMLDREQEKYLFRQYNYLKYRARKRVEHRHIKEASSYMQRAFEVRNHIVCANTRLAANIAGYNPDNEDDVSEAYIGVLKAVDRFDYQYGTKFSTYATYVIWSHKAGYSRKMNSQQRWLGHQMSETTEILAGESEHDQLRRVDHAKRDVSKLLSTLEGRDKIIIQKRFGINQQRSQTLQEVGDDLGVSKERIRMIQSKLMGLLRETADSIGINND